MTVLLNADAVNAEREALLARLAVLDEIERLAAGLDIAGSRNGVAAAAATPKTPKTAARKALPPKTTATQTGLDGLTPGALAQLEALRNAGGAWVKPDALPGIPGSRGKQLRLLVARGLVEKRGETSQREYRAVMDSSNARSKTTFGQGQPRSPRKIQQQRVLGQLKHHHLSEAQLMGVLDVGRETVAGACGALLLDEKIILRPDGCYMLAGESVKALRRKRSSP